MTSIASRITQLKEIKADIKEAIIKQGVSVDTNLFKKYPDLILSIKTLNALDSTDIAEHITDDLGQITDEIEIIESEEEE